MKFIYILISVLLPCQLLSAQGNTFRLSIQIIDQQTKQGVAKKGISLLRLGAGTTDSDGVAIIPIPSHTQMVELQVPPGFEIADPPGPILPVPASEEVVIKFWVNEVQLNKMEVQIDHLKWERDSITALAGRLELKNQLLEDQLNELTSENVALRDSVWEIAQQIGALNNQASTLDREIAEYKLVFYEKISRNYQQFLNALLDMEVALGNVSEAFTQEGELRNFNERIEALNQARNSMHENHLAYVKVVEKYWDKATSLQLMGLYEQALHNIYGDVILPLNDELIARLKDIWNGNKPRIFVQRKAVKHTDEALEVLHGEIEDMQRKAGEVLKLLESDKSI